MFKTMMITALVVLSTVSTVRVAMAETVIDCKSWCASVTETPAEYKQCMNYCENINKRRHFPE